MAVRRFRVIRVWTVFLCCVLAAGLFAGCAGTAADMTETGAGELSVLPDGESEAPPAMAEADETAPVIWPLPSAQTGRPEENTDRLLPNYTYELAEVSEVDGRQGIAWADGKYYVSGSTTLSRYDADWIPEAFTDEPFTEFGAEVNHIGDIDVYEGEIYAGVEWFMDGAASNIQIAVYDAETLEMTRTWPF